ncbi:MAG: hypothetical protein HZA72_02685 [Candidatus Omnitrophica bacterium]|nr:hypothetical protein [Candidatus Omnitrophota bacterium]
MGKKILLISCITLLLTYLIAGDESFAAWWDKEGDTSSETSTIKRTVTTGGAAVSAEAKKATEDKIHAGLKAQEWIIYLVDRDGGKGVETDFLTFTDETVNSKNLEAKGYPASNFCLFVNIDGSSSWETMKTNPATKDKVFLRGELRGNVMTGTVFMKPAKGQTSTFIFSTINPVTAQAALETATATTTTTKKGKK